MEFVELISFHVVIPVIGVVLCAFVVFAFGFRSPVQPPSFQFEEDKRNKKRIKPTKPKTSANGHVVNEAPAQNQVPKTSSTSKESKPAASPKAKQNETKNVAKKEVKQDLKSERKVKKQVQSEETSKQRAVAKKEVEDDGEWTTVQVPKKSKKQKTVASGKIKDGSLPESAVESEPEVEVSPSMEAAAAAAAPVESVVEEATSSSPVTAKVAKKKIKKEKNEKVKPEEKEEVLIVPEVEKVATEDKKKKKKEKKVSAANDGGAAAGAAAALPQEAAPASAKSVGKGAAGDLPILGEMEQEFQLAKTSPKKKKSKSKESIQEEKPEKANDAPVKQEKKIPEASSNEKKKADEPKEKAASSQVEEEPKKPVESAQPNAPTSPVSFDEIGDSWQEAAPKSKKKKPRRDN
ncbi:hypothetical protein EGW08_006332 [Elysia chlorotica]|uniref:Uncharacterized protein n=1 Tax=Elysia chlorotica TaxID=188477 RepID=A0A3S0ZU62_ELYCH|nr:hypothetical protein EGW08_006332 [Elysia chlorotica]